MLIRKAFLQYNQRISGTHPPVFIQTGARDHTIMAAIKGLAEKIELSDSLLSGAELSTGPKNLSTGHS